MVGKRIAEKAKSAGIETGSVRPFRFTGIMAASKLAEAAREDGLQF